jgi:hypothetical protein
MAITIQIVDIANKRLCSNKLAVASIGFRDGLIDGGAAIKRPARRTGRDRALVPGTGASIRRRRRAQLLPLRALLRLRARGPGNGPPGTPARSRSLSTRDSVWKADQPSGIRERPDERQPSRVIEGELDYQRQRICPGQPQTVTSDPWLPLAWEGRAIGDASCRRPPRAALRRTGGRSVSPLRSRSSGRSSAG